MNAFNSQIQSIPNSTLAHVFNRCTFDLNAPQHWLTTILVGILKVGMDANEPDSYRIIGLESCLLKLLTLLIDKRIREWAERNSILPDSQNGFREGYCTQNNSFVLKCAIDEARAQGKPLYVAFVDLKNAFPSTDLPTLWLKLFRNGVSGPLFDWLRMLYARMLYIVRHESQVSEAFQSMVGLLTGDTLSPMLWNLYFADLNIPDHKDDIVLSGRYISHVEQADDVALWSTSPEGLQLKLDYFFAWCRRNSMTISIKKTKWMLFGPLPRTPPAFLVDGKPIGLVSEYKYVGLLFVSTHRYILAGVYVRPGSK